MSDIILVRGDIINVTTRHVFIFNAATMTIIYSVVAVCILYVIIASTNWNLVLPL